MGQRAAHKPQPMQLWLSISGSSLSKFHLMAPTGQTFRSRSYEKSGKCLQLISASINFIQRGLVHLRQPAVTHSSLHHSRAGSLYFWSTALTSEERNAEIVVRFCDLVKETSAPPSLRYKPNNLLIFI